MRPDMRMRPALATESRVSTTRSTRTGRRGVAGSGVLQLGRADLAGWAPWWLAQLAVHVGTGRAVDAGHSSEGLCGALAVSRSTKF